MNKIALVFTSHALVVVVVFVVEIMQFSES